MVPSRYAGSGGRHGGVTPRLLRLLDILRLASAGGWAADRIAAHCKVSSRTIYKDLRLLAHAGIRIVADPSGYRLIDRDLILPVSLKLEELLAVLRPGSADDDTWKAAQVKLAQALPPEMRGLFTATDRVRTRPAASPVAPGIQERVEEAMARSTALEIVYENLRGDVRVRVVEPYGLYFRGVGWYVAAWAPEHGEYRTFRLDRVRRATLRSTFKPKPDFRLEAYLSDTLGAWKGAFLGARVEVLASHAAALRSEAAAKGLKLKREGDLLILEIDRGHTDEVAWWLAQFGEGVRILGPERLRLRFVAIARRLLDLNEPSHRAQAPTRRS